MPFRQNRAREPPSGRDGDFWEGADCRLARGCHLNTGILSSVSSRWNEVARSIPRQ